MSAQIQFLGGTPTGFVPFNIPSVVSSGLGFYGAAFGTSVQTGQYQDSTYITDGTGSSQGPVVHNTKRLTSMTSGVLWNGSVTDALRHIPNASGTLNIRFLFDTAVKTQNAKLYIFDRVSKNNAPSGVTCYVAELIHPWTNGFDGLSSNSNMGSGSQSWVLGQGSGSYLTMAASPGSGGLSPNGANTTDTRHDWYAAISASPDEIGSKDKFGLYVELEYL